MCITCIQSIGKIQGLSKKEKKRFANSACHRGRRTLTSYCKVICKCASGFRYRRGEHVPLEFRGNRKPGVSLGAWKLVSENLPREQKDPPPFTISQMPSSAITSFLMKVFHSPLPIQQGGFETDYCALLAGVILLFLTLRLSFSSFRTLNINGVWESCSLFWGPRLCVG